MLLDSNFYSRNNENTVEASHDSLMRVDSASVSKEAMSGLYEGTGG